MSGNLSHQIEHHLFPDLPSRRYREIAPRVREVFHRYELKYHAAPLVQQVGSAWHKVVRLSLPNGWLQGDDASGTPRARSASCSGARSTSRGARLRPGTPWPRPRPLTPSEGCAGVSHVDMVGGAVQARPFSVRSRSCRERARLRPGSGGRCRVRGRLCSPHPHALGGGSQAITVAAGERLLLTGGHLHRRHQRLPGRLVPVRGRFRGSLSPAYLNNAAGTLDIAPGASRASRRSRWRPGSRSTTRASVTFAGLNINGAAYHPQPGRRDDDGLEPVLAERRRDREQRHASTRRAGST